jgi:type I site-specific restriction-modification system R (restriction) subunit
MQPLNLPKTDLKIVKKNERRTIFDPFRRKYVTLTPEEWVRQHFVHYLVEHKGYPASIIANEVALELNGTKKRCDTVIYDNEAQPLMIIEYKASSVEITQEVFNQISRYNIKLRVKWLIVSNGLQHYCCRVDYDGMHYCFVPDIPTYETIKEDALR